MSDLPEESFIGSSYHNREDFRILVTLNDSGRLVGKIVALGGDGIADLHYDLETGEFSYDHGG